MTSAAATPAASPAKQKGRYITREQKGRYIAICWIAQIYKHIDNPKPSYTADWTDLQQWQ